MENLEELALRIYRAMFEGKKSVVIQGKKYSVLRTSKTGLRVVYAEDLRFIEQNPEKASRWAAMAREDHKIMWVIKDGHYVGQVRDGKFHDFKSKSHKRRKTPRDSSLDPENYELYHAHASLSPKSVLGFAETL